MASEAKAGDLALLIGPGGKPFLIRLEPEGRLHTHRGVVAHEDCIGQPWGTAVRSHRGELFWLLEPSTEELIRYLPRQTQILYPKDIGYILLKLSVRPGRLILEAGTGSGGLTLALAQAVWPLGRVVTYEVRPEMQALARRNLERVGLAEMVTWRIRDIAEGFDETGADALFLDLPEPWAYLPQAATALRGGGFFGAILPTANQVIRLLEALPAHGFGFIETVEILLRPYHTEGWRFRPADRMVGHTGFLIFARRLYKPPEAGETVPELEPPDQESEGASTVG
ncbi:tRNA (adenine-N1)-methyltransferase [Thermoflexus sp.]|uniref:tRNA (adenine-N1)-methyltransferase n=1 Tax=Thermoflexus sp. TaxID=1969742 RepID=UPI0035E4251C